MQPTDEEIFESFISGGCCAGYHISAEFGEQVKNDPRWFTLAEEQRQYFQCLVEPK